MSCKYKISYKSEHSIVPLQIDIKNCVRGPGYFKLNKQPTLRNQIPNIIKKSINEIEDISKGANPNSLWEFIKGTVTNETINYATKKKKESKFICKTNC